MTTLLPIRGEKRALLGTFRIGAELADGDAVAIVERGRALTIVGDALRRPVFLGIARKAATAVDVLFVLGVLAPKQTERHDEQPPTHSHHLLAEVTA